MYLLSDRYEAFDVFKRFISRPAKQGLLDQLIRVKLPRCEPCLSSKATIILLVRLQEH